VMPRIRDQAEIHTLYSPAHRKTHYPDKDWGFLIHVAMNVAAVFDSLHAKSIVIGDVLKGDHSNAYYGEYLVVYRVATDGNMKGRWVHALSGAHGEETLTVKR